MYTIIEKNSIGPTIQLQSGKYFDILDPDNSIITIDDIANGLSNICRFTGHCKNFYSVAEHSFLCSMLVSKELALDALLHDASEAFIGDVSKPLKNILPDYRAIEENIERSLAVRFGTVFPLRKEIKLIDIQMLRREQIELMPEGPAWDMFNGIEPANIELACWGPELAKSFFLERFEEIMGW